MNRRFIFALLALSTGLLLGSKADAGWGKRRCRPISFGSPCTPFPPPCVCYAPPFVAAGPLDFQTPNAPFALRFDRRLETDKRRTPEHTESIVSPNVAQPFAAHFTEPDADTFTVRRHDRGKAKTSFALAPVEEFADLRSLILSLPDDDWMKERTEKDWDFDRIPKEQRNVRVVAYLFTVAKENDNDFHLIVDDDGFLEEGAKLNVEVTGVPTEGPDVEALRSMREFFKASFGGEPPHKYRPFLDPSVRVIIEGSLFFDRDHDAGVVGPEGYRPGSAWEIHPVRNITFLPN